MVENLPVKVKIAGVYRVKHPTANFKIRVKIAQQRSSLADLFENEDDVDDANFLEAEERTFSWQEKVLGPYETKLYREERNCITDLQKEYHRTIVEENVEPSRLYSYTNGDCYFFDKDLLTEPFASDLSKRNQGALPVMKNLKPFSKRYNKNVLDPQPKRDRIRANHYLFKELEVMHVMVDLTSKDEEATVTNETLLCTVTYDKVAKNLIVDPDFSGEECYSVDGIGMVYDYWISHASEEPTRADLEMEEESLRKEIQKLQLFKKSQKFLEMKVPRKVLRLFLKLDILSAHDFPHDAVFVNYFVTVPANWNVYNEESLYGRTQRSRRKNGVAHFSYVGELLLDLELDAMERENNQLPWPQLLISVASLDSWTRYRSEGYGSATLPAHPGCHDLTIHTWRPAGDFVNKLRRFFTGGVCEIEDITYCGIPLTQDDSSLDKSNLKVISSGYVKLRLNIIHQSQAFLKMNARLNKIAKEKPKCQSRFDNTADSDSAEKPKARKKRTKHKREMQLSSE